VFSKNDFFVKQEDPKHIKDQILKFWEENIPGTPVERFEWVCNGNPAGPAVWFCLHKKGSGDIVAMTSLMPRNLYSNQRLIKAGIVGDFMINIRYRGMGLAHELQNTVFTDYPKYGFDMLYTIPNENAARALRRAGFEYAGMLREYFKPIKLSYYLSKIMKYPLIRTAILLFERLLEVKYKIGIVSISDSCFEELTRLDEPFDIFWKEYRANFQGIIGDHSSEFIKWKFFNNPEGHFRLISEKPLEGNKLNGFIIFKIQHNKLVIYDMIEKNNDCRKLMKRIIQIAYNENCSGIYFSTLKDAPLAKGLIASGFFKTKNDVILLKTGSPIMNTERCFIFSGDRNL